MKKNDINYTFKLITLLLFVIVFGFSIFSDGMFFDGIVYASVANNYAHGIGSFWEMQYTSTLHTSYHEQPPLTFFIQAQFFKLFGDSIYVERLYCFLFALLSMYLIRRIWNEVAEKNNNQFWIPILLWISIPLSAWTFQNNLLEITMGAFDLCALYFIIKGCKNNSFAYLSLGGFFTFLAFFSKGLQGLFPIIAPVLYWLTYRSVNIKQALIQFLSVLLIPFILGSLLYLYPESNHSLGLYLNRRLLGTFKNDQDTTTTHFYLLYKLLLELLIPLLLVFITWLSTRKQPLINSIDRKSVIFFCIVGMSASFPLIITLEQRAFYLTTSFPYYVMALGLIALPFVNHILIRISTRSYNYNTINSMMIILIVVLIAVMALNSTKPKRDHDLIEDLAVIHNAIPEHSTVSIPHELNTNWAYHAYFMRYCKISLDDKNKHSYFLGSGDWALPLDSCYHQLNLPLRKFKLYECE